MNIKKIAILIGIDKAILFTSSSTLVGAVGNLISAILVIRFFTVEEQGYYYTFGSIVAIQIFFELGLNGIITQFVAHENAKLKWASFSIIEGNDIHKSRLSSLLHFCVKWYFSFSLLLVLVLIPLGFYFFDNFSTKSISIFWKIPWLILSVSTAFNLLLSPLIAFLQGLGKVKEVAHFQLIAQIIRIVFVSLGLVFNFKLLVLGIGNFTLFFVMTTYLALNFRKHIFYVWHLPQTIKVNYLKEIFPFQWKIALSWLSGYFIFQLFNPVLFATEGSKVAGQMGLTLTVLNGVLTLSIAWMTTKIPLFSSLIATKNFGQLDLLFNKTLKQSSLINIFLIVIFFIFITTAKLSNFTIGRTLLIDRFINILPLFFMSVTVVINLIISSWAIYLRCHKEDPYFINSIIGGILTALSTIYLGKYFGLIGITAGYLIISLIMLPWAFKIYETKKNSWH